ncbi:MAG: hypothetical protein QM729_03600 [Solirubrobacterales bacterium]
MDTYVILRRSGWKSPAELQEAAARSSQVGEIISVADTVIMRPDPEAAAA